MPDEFDPVALRSLKAAANPVRLRLLQLAAAQRTIHPSDAKRLADQDPDVRTGGPGWHLGELERGGLVRRPRRGTYELTSRGEALLRGIGIAPAAGIPPTPRRAAVRLSVEINADPAIAEALLPDGAELVATLVRRLLDGGFGEASIRVTRAETA
jgi:hypothetical protein